MERTGDLCKLKNRGLLFNGLLIHMNGFINKSGDGIYFSLRRYTDPIHRFLLQAD